MQDYIKNIEVFNPSYNEKYIDITVPVALDMNYNLLKLRITFVEKRYIICDDRKSFNKFNNTAEYCYKLFVE